MEYEIVLSEIGKKIFKGGNIEIMKKPLIKFSEISERKAKQKYYNILTETVGSASFGNYKLVRI